MNFKFRSRLFLYLLLLLFLFVLSQAAIYLLVEWIHWQANPYEPIMEGVTEVLEATGLTLLLLPVLVGVAWLISRWMIRPLHSMAETALRIRRGAWSERIATDSMPDDETKSLAEAMNAAYDGYAAVLRRMERFSGDAAHQLRTPIAAMRSMGEVALSRSRSAEDYRETLGLMLSELDRLTRTVEQLLQLSRLEPGALKARFTAVPLHRLLDRVQQIFQPLAEAGDVELRVEVEPVDLQVNGVEELLLELLGNLVDNALRHAPHDTSVQIQGSLTPEQDLCLAVIDSGPGIPEEFAQTIFDRFTQVPDAESGTAGLGLSLAAEIAAVHGGKLVLANPGRPGARFECRLPLPANALNHIE
jgi:signal transduction histidine kinase